MTKIDISMQLYTFELDEETHGSASLLLPLENIDTSDCQWVFVTAQILLKK